MRPSAGILLYNNASGKDEPEVFLVRANHVSDSRELWGVPKGRIEEGENLIATARREFFEETGTVVPPQVELKRLPVFQTNYGKRIYIFSGELNDTSKVAWDKNNVKYTSGKRNGRLEYYQETRDGAWFPFSEAYNKIGTGQQGILDLFRTHLLGF